jgi:phosphoribosylformylglycinamidine cyclo-ligase
MKYTVDIEAGNAFAKSIPIASHGFGGAFRVPSGYEKPVLISGADGVGTKLNICQVAGDYTTIGIDLVAMCVNDVICSGAKPLYFLDYISTQKIDQNLGQIMEGIIKGCGIADIELIGGETAEHFRQKNYDLAGFCTGIVEEGEILDGRMIKKGDKIIGFASSGLHSNGYTLINDMLWRQKIYYRDYPELLTPTTIYSPMIQRLLDEVPILGMAHITGGGIPENLPRCLPDGLTAHVDYNSWPLPKIFSDIMLAGEIVEEDMKTTFNCGIGFCIIVPPDVTIDAEIESWEIGEVQ